jgi:F-type H+-transporting ATPase subunit epsilon
MPDNTKLNLEIITPDGVVLHESDVDEVVFRRMEADFENGSEVAIFPSHGPTLVRVPVTAIRFHDRGRWHYVALAGGFIEVKNNRVRVVTAESEVVDPDDPGAAERAQELAVEWRGLARGARESLVGYRR